MNGVNIFRAAFCDAIREKSNDIGAGRLDIEVMKAYQGNKKAIENAVYRIVKDVLGNV